MTEPTYALNCRYSNIVCSGYPLGALDSILPDGSTNWYGVTNLNFKKSKRNVKDMYK